MSISSFAVVTLFLCASPGLAGEPAPVVPKWADHRLTIRNGLIGWYDASRLHAAREALGLPPVKAGDRLELWPDASPARRHLKQEQPAQRPIYQATDNFHAVRFDGLATHVHSSSAGRPLREMTVFVVAAPLANREPFTALLAASAAGHNDYESGWNIDQGPAPSTRFQALNVEGAGQQGAVNLLKDTFDFGVPLRLCVRFRSGSSGTAFWVNGKLQDTRDRAERSQIRMDQFVVGARYYTNGGPPEVRGFGSADIAEVLLFDRALGSDERSAVDSYLWRKYAGVARVRLPPDVTAGKPLVRVPDPPAVQVLVPGFTVRRLPVELANINNVLYRADGKLVALGYNGNVYLLSDTDGDGLEDKVELFWENKGRIRAPIGMALTPPGYRHGNGVFVASKGKCSLLVDTDGDGKADREIIVADGWTELPHGVDALGVAVDPRDQSVYFGLGTQDFTDPYGLSRKDAIGYTLRGERGTVLRVSPDFKSREIFATGIRFSVGLRFNRHGDLFGTDQEGATWLANGNPLDELLHLQRGRHYGFPPRHPQYLPGVIDEPSLFDYGPQHQSTCGLSFNEPVNDGPVFGPHWWRSDLFVAGYSRGKLYRTKLVKTPAGYVAQNQLFACLNMLTVDVCISPQGDLVVATHSGGPDWGSGPNGKGRLYKITPARDAPQPVLAWPQTPRELRVAFDRPLSLAQLAGLSSGTSIEYGQYVAAGDHFESLWPGYKVVQDQMRTPRYALQVHGVGVSSDRRTLIIATAPHPEAVSYAITLRGLGRPPGPDARRGQLPQVAETDMRYDLCGVEASWRASGGSAPDTVWLPHLDTAVSRALTRHSSGHEQLWQRCRQDGELVLRTTLNLHDMLRPQVQPGSRINYALPAERVTLTLRGSTIFRLIVTGRTAVANKEANGGYSVAVVLPDHDQVPLEVVLPTGASGLDLGLSWHTTEDGRPRALPLHRLLLPWAPAARAELPMVAAVDVPQLRGGNWSRGRTVFFSEQAACSKCHRVQGEGGAIGPDLSNLPQRDYGSVLRDIAEPSFAINPDYITQVVLCKDGRMLTGTVRTQKDMLLVGDDKGRVTTIRKVDVEDMQPSKLSVMPEGLPRQLGPDKMRDLLTFLLTEPPHMPDYGPGQPPPPRSRAEVAAVLAGSPPLTATPRPLRVVLVAGAKDHGPGEHDYPAWQESWGRLLRMADGVMVQTAQDWPTADSLAKADVLVFYQHGQWTPRRARDIDAYLARGGGLVYLHYAVDGGSDAPGFAQRIGLAWQGGQSKFRHGALELGFETGSRHPIGRNLDCVRFQDESYWQLVGDPRRITVLASVREESGARPMFWTLGPAGGRVFVSIPGHFAWTFDDPLFRILLLRGIAWTARQPVDRFNDLALPAARIKD
jgi:putative heme-binding domain-containing protein